MSEKIKGLIEKIPSRYWIYLAVGVAAMLDIALPLALTETESVWYSLFWGAFGTAAAVIITRCIYHCATGDNSAEMWAISIYGVVADLGWLVGILTESYSVATIGIVILAAGMMMALGTRFVGKDGAKVKRAEVETLLAKTLRYRYMGDVIDGEVDIRRPLVIAEGVKDPMTVEEAYKSGYEKEAEDAMSYIRMAVDNTVAKEKVK